MTKISSLTAMTAAQVDDTVDLITVVDMSETGAARNKKMTFDEASTALAPDTIDEIGNVDAAAPTDGQVLTYESSAGTWMPQTPVAGGGGVDIEDEDVMVLADATTINFTGAGVLATNAGGGQVDVTIPGAGSVASLNDVGDVNADSPMDGQVLTYDGSADVWYPADSSGGGASAFTNLTDAPASYAGQTGRGVFVNSGETALEFLPVTTGGHETLDVDYTDGGNSGTSETDIFTYTVPASELEIDGDRLEAQWAGTAVGHATATRQFKAYFGGTAFFDSGALSITSNASWDIYCTITRVSSTVVRYALSMTVQNAPLAAYTASGELTGLTLSSTNIFKLTGTAAGVGAATNDIVGKTGFVEKRPKNPSIILSLAQGPSFPTSPAISDRFFRIDRDIEYIYDGTQWLSTQLVSVQIGFQSGTGATADVSNGRSAVPYRGVYSLYVEAVDFTSFLSSTAIWNLNVNYVDAANASTLVATRSTSGDPASNNWTSAQVAVGAVLSTNARVLEFVLDETTGTATCFANVIIWCRLVG